MISYELEWGAYRGWCIEKALREMSVHMPGEGCWPSSGGRIQVYAHKGKESTVLKDQDSEEMQEHPECDGGEVGESGSLWLRTRGYMFGNVHWLVPNICEPKAFGFCCVENQ